MMWRSRPHSTQTSHGAANAGVARHCLPGSRRPSIAAGLVSLPTDAPWSKELLAEIAAFPGGKHDDQVDPLLDAVANLLLTSSYNLDGLGGLMRVLGGTWEAQQRARALGM